MNKPTTNQIKEAKDFIRKRLEAERIVVSYAQDEFLTAAKQILELSYKYKIRPELFRFSSNKSLEAEVNEVLSLLKQQIISSTDTLATYDEDRKEQTIPFVHRGTHGKTFDQRLDIYTNRYKYELESVIAAGLTLGISKDKILNSIRGNLKHPYSNPYFLQSAGKVSIATRLRTSGISYGVGKTNSAFTGVENLTRFAVAEAWMENLKYAFGINGATGFYSMRGSSYPCSLCDSMEGFHDSLNEFPPYHLNCCCLFIPFYL